MVIKTSVDSFSRRIRFSTMAVKSGDESLVLASSAGVCVAIKVYAGICCLRRVSSAHKCVSC